MRLKPLARGPFKYYLGRILVITEHSPSPLLYADISGQDLEDAKTGFCPHDPVEE